ncbi:phosphate signaling complex protein PhoU [Desulfosporosinus sp. BICA1-9]|uniref:phosphate signaling complex protein PhoU n=1 Tax=Desulfosporosinus sp. BICA1-9 TaxID=1531958 RepID=UPI00054B93AC|nr:phosphate signaling complex protein PhoU [Desulfosporosinus sp. BICA1-9]KJS47756.1 MAG: PhoU family transcriptional regulator [Peptococcaceae bacterium BRH_c23]KJS88477.1 MAG: PhoU family transcriptional regulator [Desulfosporosinus sp. BICA1-9]HBW34676.1 phosphate transport system regulatory protein PhoU [Desulfosporosinus sp.]
MPTRQKFSNDLEELRLNILDLGNMVDQQISLAVGSLINQDMELANTIVVKDLEINDLQAIIEEKCILLIATQQPLAGDLRKVVAGFKVSIYLERMGDLSVDLAKLTIRIGEEPLIKPLVDIPRMSALVHEMLDLGLKAYVQDDCQSAAQMTLIDDEIDLIYSQVFGDLRAIMMEDPNKVTQANYLLFASRFLERLGDYCTNIGEEIVYICTGKRVDLNE